MNELLFFITILVNFIGVLIVYKFFDKTGLFIWIAISTIIANIEVTKCIDLFGLSLTLGNVSYSSTFLVTDILSEMYGSKEARKSVIIGFFAMIIFTLIMQLDLMFIPNSEDIVSSAMQTIFSIMPRICIASLISYLISNMLDTYLYEFIRNKFPDDKLLWLRNNGSTLISQFIDSIVFTTISFIGMYSNKVLIELIITTYIVKALIAILDTPFLYMSKIIYKYSKKSS